MRTNKGDVALADTGCLKLGIGGVLASLLIGFVEQFEEARIGETIKIVEGAFADLTGKITEIDNEKMKLKVNIEMFGRETATELDFDQVDKLL